MKLVVRWRDLFLFAQWYFDDATALQVTSLIVVV
jgi:hypothetical protein